MNRPPVDRANAVAKGLSVAVALSFLGVFASDYAWLEYRMGHDTAGQALGSVTFYYATPLKNGRTEIFYDQPQTEVCVLALFPHAGYRPCWYAKKSQVRMVSLVGPFRHLGSIGIRQASCCDPRPRRRRAAGPSPRRARARLA